MAEAEVVKSLFVTLRRSYAGTPWFHQRILKALGLKRRHHCYEKPNNESIRGMLLKVPHLVIVETDKMFYLRRMRDYYEQLQRPPLVLPHTPVAATAIEQGLTTPAQVSTFIRKQVQEHAAPVPQLEQGFEANQPPLPRKPRKYFKDLAQERKAQILAEQGLFSKRLQQMEEREAEKGGRFMPNTPERRP